MAMIRLKHGDTFFGSIKDYDWKGKFLVVEISEMEGNVDSDSRIISWNNVESVYDCVYKNGGGRKKMNKDEKKALKIESKIVVAWSELVHVLGALESAGVEVEDLKKGKGMIRDGLEVIISSIMKELE
jgi:hypothetical protein